MGNCCLIVGCYGVETKVVSRVVGLVVVDVDVEVGLIGGNFLKMVSLEVGRRHVGLMLFLVDAPNEVVIGSMSLDVGRNERMSQVLFGLSSTLGF